MFFDTLGKRVTLPNGRTARQTVQRRPFLRFLIVGLILAPAVAGMTWVSWQFARETWNLPDSVSPWLVAAAILLFATFVTKLRGFSFVGATAIIVTGGFWALHHSFVRDTDLPSFFVRLNWTDTKSVLIILRYFVYASSAVCVVSVLWYLRGVCFGGNEWFDPVLGNRVRPKLSPEVIVAYVIYREWMLFEAITYNEYQKLRFVPVRQDWLPSVQTTEALQGPTHEGEWTHLIDGQASVYTLLDGTRWSIAKATGKAQCLLEGPLFEGVRCERPPGRPSTVSRNIARDQNRNEPNHVGLRIESLKVKVAAPTAGTPSVIHVRMGTSKRHVQIARIEWDGFVFAPVSTTWELTDVDRPKMEAFYKNSPSVTLIVTIPSAENVEHLGALLQAVIPKEAVRHLRVSVSGKDAALREWIRYLGNPAIEVALQYLQWASDMTQCLPNALQFDPLSGWIWSDADCENGWRLLDLGTSLLLAPNEGNDSRPIILPMMGDSALANLREQISFARTLSSLFPSGKDGVRTNSES